MISAVVMALISVRNAWQLNVVRHSDGKPNCDAREKRAPAQTDSPDVHSFSGHDSVNSKASSSK
jgi:hypothetical protein